MVHTSLLLEYRFSSHSAKKMKKIVALIISILCAVMSLMIREL